MKQFCMFYCNIFDSFWVTNHTKHKRDFCVYPFLASWCTTLSGKKLLEQKNCYRYDYKLHTVVNGECKLNIKTKLESAQNVPKFRDIKKKVTRSCNNDRKCQIIMFWDWCHADILKYSHVWAPDTLFIRVHNRQCFRRRCVSWHYLQIQFYNVDPFFVTTVWELLK